MSSYVVLSICAFFSIGICALGLYSDVCMYFLLKSGNLTKETKLVAWKANTQKEDASVPIRATSIGLITFVICWLTAGLAWKFSSEGTGIAVLLRLLWAIGLLPVLLGLAVKNQQKKVGPQPPQKLQFHDQHFEMEQERPPRIRDLEEGLKMDQEDENQIQVLEVEEVEESRL